MNTIGEYSKYVTFQELWVSLRPKWWVQKLREQINPLGLEWRFDEIRDAEECALDREKHPEYYD